MLPYTAERSNVMPCQVINIWDKVSKSPKKMHNVSDMIQDNIPDKMHMIPTKICSISGKRVATPCKIGNVPCKIHEIPIKIHKICDRVCDNIPQKIYKIPSKMHDVCSRIGEMSCKRCNISDKMSLVDVFELKSFWMFFLKPFIILASAVL